MTTQFLNVFSDGYGDCVYEGNLFILQFNAVEQIVDMAPHCRGYEYTLEIDGDKITRLDLSDAAKELERELEEERVYLARVRNGYHTPQGM